MTSNPGNGGLFGELFFFSFVFKSLCIEGLQADHGLEQKSSSAYLQVNVLEPHQASNFSFLKEK